MSKIQKIDFLTAATVAYLPQALVVLRGARSFGINGSISFFAVDAMPETVAALRSLLKDESWLEIFGPYDLSEDSDAFVKAFAYFSPLEISCLAKYVGVRHMLSRPSAADCCVFADADVMLLGDLQAPLRDLEGRAFLLTPHQIELSTDQVELEYLRSGWINAGFFAVRKSDAATTKILDWLINRITRLGFFAPAHGMYCDQSWLSQLPIAFDGDVAISNHPGMNVAYWNLVERELSLDGGHFYANGSPMVFFHFSGFNGFKHNRLSKHSGVSIDPGSPLAEICRKYLEDLSTSDYLIPEFRKFKTIPCSTGSLQVRLERGAALNGIAVGQVGGDHGVFTRIGRRADAMVRDLICRWKRIST